MSQPLTQLHFNEHGHIKSSKVLTFALDKSHITKLTHEECTFHIFYQLLAQIMLHHRSRIALHLRIHLTTCCLHC